MEGYIQNYENNIRPHRKLKMEKNQ